MMPTGADLTQQGKYVQANGLHVFYEEYGQGRPLILLHGGTSSSATWKPYIPIFANHFRVITPDARGHGRTDNPTGEFSYRLLADDMAAFVEALGLPKPFICGKSDGGQTALEIGMRVPNLAGALVVGAAWYRFTDTMRSFLRSTWFEGPGVVNFEQLQKAEPDWVGELKTEHVRANDAEYWRTLLQQISTMWWTPLDYTPQDFLKITCPTLILMGDRDETVAVEQAVEMYRLIPNAELAIMPNATHSSITSELSMNAVLDFLVRHDTPDKLH
jgi:pimeloyl-ACP methyl ester carboxylesterase